MTCSANISEVLDREIFTKTSPEKTTPGARYRTLTRFVGNISIRSMVKPRPFATPVHCFHEEVRPNVLGPSRFGLFNALFDTYGLGAT